MSLICWGRGWFLNRSFLDLGTLKDEILTSFGKKKPVVFWFGSLKDTFRGRWSLWLDREHEVRSVKAFHHFDVGITILGEKPTASCG